MESEATVSTAYGVSRWINFRKRILAGGYGCGQKGRGRPKLRWLGI